MKEIKYWRISPGEGGYLWREQKLNECIALGWSGIGSAKGLNNEEKLRARIQSKRPDWNSSYGANQLHKFINVLDKGDKVVASVSGKGIYALGTITGDYKFDMRLEYSHSRNVFWETTFWHPVPIEDLALPEKTYNKFHGQSSQTIRQLDEPEWNHLCKGLSEVRTSFRNLAMWGGLIQSPEYENEVIILFSHMLQHFGMRIVGFGTRFPDAIVEHKKNGRWKRVNIEFELYSSGFADHLHACDEKNCDTIICWEDDWNDRIKRRFKIIELKHELEKIL